jgi:hypothetical protein
MIIVHAINAVQHVLAMLSGHQSRMLCLLRAVKASVESRIQGISVLVEFSAGMRTVFQIVGSFGAERVDRLGFQHPGQVVRLTCIVFVADVFVCEREQAFGMAKMLFIEVLLIERIRHGWREMLLLLLGIM